MRRIPLLLVAVAGVLLLTAGSAVAGALRTASPPVNGSLPTIAGTAQQGHTLTASNGAWTGDAPISFTYQWQRCNSSGSSCAAISGAKSQNYVASSGDVGNTDRVQVTGTNADGTSQALSGPTAVIVQSGNAPANTKQPNPSGTALEGKTITVNHGSWSGTQPITFTYQWQSCTAAPVCTNIAGMTGSSLLLGAGQVGTAVRATVTATNAVGSTSAFSNETGVVVAKPRAPVNTGLPAISGSSHVGQRVTASTGTWTSATPSTYTYQWSRCDSNGTACSSVYGATGQSYGIGQVDLGMAIRVVVTAKNVTGSTGATSPASKISARIVTTASFRSVLRPGQELTYPNGRRAASIGHFTGHLIGKTLRWTLTYSHLSGRPTVARLNRGVRGTNGAAFKSLCRTCTTTTRGTLTLTASQLDAMLKGRTYVNVHTAMNTRGEIRGQISRVS